MRPPGLELLQLWEFTDGLGMVEVDGMGMGFSNSLLNWHGQTEGKRHA